MTASSFALAPAGSTFPRFAFLAITKETIAITHHWKDGETLRKRTDRFPQEKAAALICTLTDLGYKHTDNLSHS